MSLKKKIESNELTLGGWITLGHPSIAEIMANTGFDWITIDLEHSVITVDQAQELIRVIDLCGVAPLVRLTSHNPDLIKRVLDAGAHGLIVPMVNSAEEARNIIKHAYYPPKGKRSFGLARAQGYGTEFQDHIENNLSEMIIVVQIEHIQAVAELKDILSLKEVDAFIVGPYDLSGSMGIPGQFSNSKYLKVLDEIKDIARQTGTPGGIHIVEPEPDLLRKASKEYKFIAYGVDFRMIDLSCRKGLSSLLE